MKAAIVTITNGANYGNRLQNYALQTKIESLGAETVTLRWRNVRDLRPVRRFLSDAKYVVKRALGMKVTDRGRRLRRKNFERFNREYVSFGKELLADNRAPEGLADKYDVFVCGSDQVWNAKFGFVRHDINNYLASFARGEQRVSYAASFGTDEVPLEYREVFAAELAKFRAIGIREDKGCEIAEELTGRNDVVRVPDPVLMLTREEWEKVASMPAWLQRAGEEKGIPCRNDVGEVSPYKYIVTYFLGGRDEKMQTYLELLSRQYGAEVIDLEAEFLKDGEIRNMDVFSSDPGEFVWLIAHAECVVSDSFHATAFALLFGKQFAVFERRAREENNDMGSRIQTLLGTYGLQEFAGSIEEPAVTPKAYDTEAVLRKIAEERLLGEEFLRKAICS